MTNNASTNNGAQESSGGVSLATFGGLMGTPESPDDHPSWRPNPKPETRLMGNP